MKSFCVLNMVLSSAAGESVGSALCCALGGKIGVLTDGSVHAKELEKSVCGGVSAAGGTAVRFGDGFEAQIKLFIAHYSLDAGVFISSKDGCLMSVYGADGRELDSETESKVSAAAALGVQTSNIFGSSVEIDGERVYFDCLLKTGDSFENVSAKIECGSLLIRRLLGGALAVLGGVKSEKPKIFVSASGNIISACDETGGIRTHSELLAVCCACEIEQKKPLRVGFAAPGCLDEIAAGKGVRLQRSFDGGGEIWQRDGVLLAAKLLGLMSLRGEGLAGLCASLPNVVTRRRMISASVKLGDLADLIGGDTVVSEGRGVFTRLGGGSALITPCGSGKRLCLEVQAAANETADEICADITQAVSLTKYNI